MRVLFYLLAICLLLTGCSTSSQLVRSSGFVIAQQAPVSPATDHIEARSPAVQTLITPISLQVPASYTSAGQKINTHTAKKQHRLAAAVRKTVHHIPQIQQAPSYAHVYTATKAVLQGKHALDNAGCTCVALMVLAAALTIGISLLWKAIFGKGISFYGLIVIGAILALILIFAVMDN